MQQGHVLTYGLRTTSRALLRSTAALVDQLSNVDVVVAKSLPVALHLIQDLGAQSLLLGRGRLCRRGGKAVVDVERKPAGLRPGLTRIKRASAT